MTRTPARLLGFALALTASCTPSAPKSRLPSDLPPPEYETPRGYDLGGVRKDAAPAATVAPSAAPAATSAAPSAPPAPAPAAPKP